MVKTLHQHIKQSNTGETTMDTDNHFDEKSVTISDERFTMKAGDHANFSVKFPYGVCAECLKDLPIIDFRRYILKLRYYRGKLDFRFTRAFFNREDGHLTYDVWITPELSQAIKRRRQMRIAAFTGWFIASIVFAMSIYRLFQ